MNYLVLDLETTTKKVFGRMGNPWYNSIIAIGLKKPNKNAESIYKFPKNTINYILEKNMNGIDLLIGHNVKYDLLHLWKYPALLTWIEKGGKIWDTMIVEYLITGQQSKFSKLRDLAVKKYSAIEREKKMEAYWEQGIDTGEIPKNLVIEDVEADVCDTELIFLEQQKFVKMKSLDRLVETQMEFLLATTEMEYNGIKVNLNVLNRNEQEIQFELRKLYKELEILVGRYWYDQIKEL